MVSLGQNRIIIRFEGPGSLSIEFRVHLSKVEKFLNSTNFDKLGLDREHVWSVPEQYRSVPTNLNTHTIVSSNTL